MDPVDPVWRIRQIQCKGSSRSHIKDPADAVEKIQQIPYKGSRRSSRSSTGDPVDPVQGIRQIQYEGSSGSCTMDQVDPVERTGRSTIKDPVDSIHGSDGSSTRDRSPFIVLPVAPGCARAPRAAVPCRAPGAALSPRLSVLRRCRCRSRARPCPAVPSRAVVPAHPGRWRWSRGIVRECGPGPKGRGCSELRTRWPAQAPVVAPQGLFLSHTASFHISDRITEIYCPTRLG